MFHTAAEYDNAMTLVLEVRERADLAGDETAVLSLGLALDALLDERIHLPAQR